MSVIDSQEGLVGLFVFRPSNHRLHGGAAAILGLVLLLSLAALMAIAIDFGYIHVAETELRRSADAAAMAGCWEVFAQQDKDEELNNALPAFVVNAANRVEHRCYCRHLHRLTFAPSHGSK